MERNGRNHLISAFFALFFALSSFASPQGTTYQARIVKPDGQALESASVNFKFTILDPVGSCILYAETFSAISMANSSGMISFALGSGVKSYPASSTTFAQVFNNSTPTLSCDTGGPASYSPAATDIRKIVMQFNDGSGWQTLPAMAINAVPYAIYSSDSLSLGGVSATNYIQYSTIPSCAASEALRYNGTNFSCINVASGGGASGTITSSDVTSALGYTPANQSSVATSFTTVSNSLSTVGTSFTTVTSTINSLGTSVTALSSTVSGLSASMAAFTNSQWVTSGATISYTSGNVGIGTSSPTEALHVAGSIRSTAALIGANVRAPTLYGSNISGGGLWIDSTSDSTKGDITIGAVNGNRVGIGTSPHPFSALTVRRNNATYPLLILGMSSSENNRFGITAGTGYYGGMDFMNDSLQARWRVQKDGSAEGGSNTGSNFTIERFNDAGASNGNAFTILRTNGNVGIGTSSPVTALDVAGGVRLGAESASCAAALAGTLRYSGGTVEYCNGASWQAFGGNVTSSAVITALGYTPANSATTATSFTAVTSTVNSLSSSVTALSSTVSGLSSSMASFTSSQWVNNSANIYFNTGRVGIGTNSPSHKLDVSGVVLVSGEYGSGETLAASGAGSRMFFYPKKAAFRAGYAGANEWDDNNIADASIALGDSPIASGYGSISLGVGTIASGPYSVALGRYSQALGQSSVALGEAQATGDLSTAFDSSYAGGLYSVAMGSSSANADRSISIGQGSNANGLGSIAIGHQINANAMNVVAVGSYNVGNGSGTAWLSTDPIFEVGNSQNGSPRSNAMTVLKNGHVGVGVLSPTAKLHLAAGTSATASLKITSGTLLSAPQAGAIEYDGSNLYYTDGTNARRTIATDGASGTFSNMVTSNIYGSAASGGSLYIDSTTHATKGHIVLAPNGGNVGIGTTTPTTKLSVVETNATDAVISLSRPAGQQGIFTYATGSNPRWMTYVTNEPESGSNAGSNFGISRWSDAGAFLGNALLLKRDTGNILLAPTGGNVGIGLDTNPSFPLDIASSDAFQTRILHASNNANDDAAIMMVRQRGTTSAGSAVLNNDSIGGMYFRAHDGTGTGTSNAHIEVAAGENQTATNKGSVMTFATTQNGQATRQEIMRIHSNGFVGIGNTTPNALLQVGPSGSQSANYNIYVASYRSTAGQGQYVGNWISSDYWALGPATNAADKTLRLGIASDRTGTWSATQDLSLAIGGNLNVSGAIRTAEDLIPANTVILMDSCPSGWTDIGATGGGPGAVTCNGVTCRMCQTSSATLVPPDKHLLMESCPAGWTFKGQAVGPAMGGYMVSDSATVPFGSCLSPSTNSVMPKGARLIAQTCPAEWKDLGATGTGQLIAACPVTACRVCETPSGMSNVRLVYGGEASGTAYGGHVNVVGGKGTSGGWANLRGGNSVNGFGGSVTITGGTASSTSGLPYSGGSVSITGGSGILGGEGGQVTIQAGYNIASGTYNRLFLNPNGGFVGVNTSNPEGRFEVHGLSFVGNNIATNVSEFASGGIRLSYNNSSDYSDAITFAHIGNNGPGTAIGFRKSGYDTNIDFYTNSNANAVQGGMVHAATISSSGWLGVGTSAPISVLHARNSSTVGSAVATLETTGVGGRPYLQFRAENMDLGYIGYAGTGDENLMFWNKKPGYLFFGTSATATITVTPSMNVGIGDVISPLEKLHVDGDISLGTPNLSTRAINLFQTAAGGNNAYGIYFDGLSGGSYKTQLRVNGSDLLTAHQNLNVGIATSSPQNTLHVVNNKSFSPGSNVNSAIMVGATTGSAFGGGVLMKDVTYYGGMWLTGNGTALQLGAGGTSSGFAAIPMTITSSTVGIGTANPSYTLDVNGSARATGSVAAWSDIRTKKNIEVIPDSLGKILQLRGVTFDWRTDEFPDKKFKTTRDIGVIAQEVEKVFPEAVQTAPDSYKSVAYSQLVAPLIEAVKELYYTITGVKREVASLKAENAELKQRLERLEKQMLENQKSK